MSGENDLFATRGIADATWRTSISADVASGQVPERTSIQVKNTFNINMIEADTSMDAGTSNAHASCLAPPTARLLARRAVCYCVGKVHRAHGPAPRQADSPGHT